MTRKASQSQPPLIIESDPPRRLAAGSAELSAAIARYLDRWNAPNGVAWLRLIDLLKAAKTDPAIADAAPAQGLIDILIEMLSDSGPDDPMQPFNLIDELLPAGSFGKPFADRAGRGESSIKKLVRKVLPSLEKRLKRKAKSSEVWTACAATRDHGIMFATLPPWGTPLKAIPRTGDAVGWARFRVIVSEVRGSPQP